MGLWKGRGLWACLNIWNSTPIPHCQDKWDELDDESDSSHSHTVIDFLMIPMDNFLVRVEW